MSEKTYDVIEINGIVDRLRSKGLPIENYFSSENDSVYIIIGNTLVTTLSNTTKAKYYLQGFEVGYSYGV